MIPGGTGTINLFWQRKVTRRFEILEIPLGMELISPFIAQSSCLLVYKQQINNQTNENMMSCCEEEFHL